LARIAMSEVRHQPEFLFVHLLDLFFALSMGIGDPVAGERGFLYQFMSFSRIS
jgi:hypothetical protein